MGQGDRQREREGGREGEGLGHVKGTLHGNLSFVLPIYTLLPGCHPLQGLDGGWALSSGCLDFQAEAGLCQRPMHSLLSPWNPRSCGSVLSLWPGVAPWEPHGVIVKCSWRSSGRLRRLQGEDARGEVGV